MGRGVNKCSLKRRGKSGKKKRVDESIWKVFAKQIFDATPLYKLCNKKKSKIIPFL